MTYEQLFRGEMKVHSAILHQRNLGRECDVEAVALLFGKLVELRQEFSRKCKGRARGHVLYGELVAAIASKLCPATHRQKRGQR